MNKTNYLYFLITCIIIFITIYGGFFYNFYIHPSEVLNSLGRKEIILFGDFKYLFKIINCHNSGFDVYSPNDCYSDYYGSFLYGPSILIFPEINEKIAQILMYFLSTALILGFVYLTINIIKPYNIFTYFLSTLILLNPTTLFLYEKLNIDIVIYISLIILVYFSKKDLIKLIIVIILTTTKFYPAVFSVIFLIKKNNEIKNLFYFLLSIILILIFFYSFKEDLSKILGTLKFVSQSFKYSFSLETLNKILNYIGGFNYIIITKFILIAIFFFLSFFIYSLCLQSNEDLIEKKTNASSDMFILSSSLAILLYLIFGNNFYREIYLIGTIPFILSHLDKKFFRITIYIFIIKYIYLLIFFPYYYKSDLTSNLLAQFLVGFKSLLDFIFISILTSILFLFIKIYLKKYLMFFKKKNEF